MAYDMTEACLEVIIVLLQLTPMFQAYECVMASMESTAMLDFKYVMGVYKAIPQTFLKTYIMFAVAMSSDEYDMWVLTSIALSIISITIIFIMRYDRKEARRMAMASVKDQPICAVYLAAFLTACGMGKDTIHVEGFVNFDSYYTSHYVWAYVYQLVAIYSRVVSLSWLLATVPYSMQILVPYIIIWTRLMLLLFIDDRFFHHTIYHNFVKSLSLGISDSAWAKDPYDSRFSRMCIICLGIMTTCEDAIAAIYVCFVSPYLQYPKVHLQGYFIGVFCSLIVAWIIRWVLTFHWLLHIHFPDLYIASTATSTLDRSEMREIPMTDNPMHHPAASSRSPASAQTMRAEKLLQEEEDIDLKMAEIYRDPDEEDAEADPAAASHHQLSEHMESILSPDHIAAAINEQWLHVSESMEATLGWKSQTPSDELPTPSSFKGEI
jgi:hypothetical protein